MENYLGIAFTIYIIGLIGCYIYEGWRNGYGNTKDDNYFWPLIWPVFVAFGVLCIIVGVPIVIIVYGLKFIFDIFIFIGNFLRKMSTRSSKKVSVKSRWLK